MLRETLSVPAAMGVGVWGRCLGVQCTHLFLVEAQCRGTALGYWVGGCGGGGGGWWVVCNYRGSGMTEFTQPPCCRCISACWQLPCLLRVVGGASVVSVFGSAVHCAPVPRHGCGRGAFGIRSLDAVAVVVWCGT